MNAALSKDAANTSSLDKNLFLLTYGVMSIGLSVALLDATAITTNAGHRTNGAIYTSLYLCVLLLTAALTVPYAPALAARFTARSAFNFSVAAGSVAWLVASLLILNGVEPIPVLMVNAVVVGALFGLFTAFGPLFSKAYLTGDGMAGAYARLSVAGAIGMAIGGIAGGAILNQVEPGWGLFARAVVGIPFAIFIWLKPPPVEPHSPKPERGPWTTMYVSVRDNRELRRASILGWSVSMLAAPLASLIVPVADALRQSPLLPGAGILMAGMYIGQLLSPAIVKRLSIGRSEINASAIAAIWTGLLLAVYGAASLIFQMKPELIVWAIIGLVFGALWLAQRSINLQAATDAGDEATTGEAVAVFMFAVSLAAPIGVLIWGLLINHVSVEAAIFAGAAGTVLAGIAYLKDSKAAA
ncbi:MAG: MFS transporter [Actinomycetes bacterium]